MEHKVYGRLGQPCVSCGRPIERAHFGAKERLLLPLVPAVAWQSDMCRNITTLRGLEPPATPVEVEAAARQFVRKVSGVASVSALSEDAFERAVRKVSEATAELLGDLPPRRQPPPTLPPLRRIKAHHG